MIIIPNIHTSHSKFNKCINKQIPRYVISCQQQLHVKTGNQFLSSGETNKLCVDFLSCAVEWHIIILKTQDYVTFVSNNTTPQIMPEIPRSWEKYHRLVTPLCGGSGPPFRGKNQSATEFDLRQSKLALWLASWLGSWRVEERGVTDGHPRPSLE